MIHIKKGITYWGITGTKEVERRVNLIETRNSGTRYVNWTHIKKDGSEGNSRWTEYQKFAEWAKGIYELAEGHQID